MDARAEAAYVAEEQIARAQADAALLSARERARDTRRAAETVVVEGRDDAPRGAPPRTPAPARAPVAWPTRNDWTPLRTPAAPAVPRRRPTTYAEIHAGRRVPRTARRVVARPAFGTSAGRRTPYGPGFH